MYRTIATVTLLLGAHLALADHKSMDAARQRIVEKAMAKDLAAARKLPRISAAAFVKAWRPLFDEYVAAVCRCPNPRLDVALWLPDENGTPVPPTTNECVTDANVAFEVGLMPTAFRLPGFLESLDRGASDAEMGKLAKKLVEDALDAEVPAKEQLQRQAKLRRCTEQAGV